MTRDDQRMDNPAARMGREADMLKKRLADLEAERPVLAALYGALTPGQREMLSPRYHIEMAGGVMDRGMMRRGADGDGRPSAAVTAAISSRNTHRLTDAKPYTKGVAARRLCGPRFLACHRRPLGPKRHWPKSG